MTRDRVLVTRAAGQADELLAAMRDAGLSPVSVPTISVEIDPERGRLDVAAGSSHTYRWVVVTSANGARAILEAAKRAPAELTVPSWAAVGPATRRALERAGIEVAFQPIRSTGAAMAAELPVVRGDRVLVVRGDLADGELATTLRARGADVDDVVAYRTREAPEASRGMLRTAVTDGSIAAVVFTSGSTVRGLLSLGQAESIDVRAFPAVCIGTETADEARRAGFRILAVSPVPTSAALAAATVNALVRQLQETA
jgi:uroporphyrinogen-III synthase